MIQPGKQIFVKAYKADGRCYRSWMATVEAADEAGIITVNPPGHIISGDKGTKAFEYAIRSYYWFRKPYNLLEVYRTDGTLREIYIHISSPPLIEDSSLRYTDYELDVVRFPGQAPFIDDEDEFEQAAGLYGYTPQFREACYGAVKEAIELANQWIARGYR